MDKTFVVCFTDGTKERFSGVSDCEVSISINTLFLVVGSERIMFNWNHVRYVANEDNVIYTKEERR